ncbi:MAG TPA: transcriptional regulator [candidate division Zixibacteria bacterium]|nr:transcriptional regulator [candidate division Zixibacteria bacterium]HER00305.1 transcriptional regulator [candidate division Zixibacteria bacterium]
MGSPNKKEVKYQTNGCYSPYDIESIFRLSEAFKVLGDATKLRICILLSERELPVSGIAAELDLSDSAASHSLRILRNLRLVKFRREGKMIYYSLDDDHVKELIKVGYDHILEEK